MERELESVLKDIQAQLAALTERVGKLEGGPQPAQGFSPATEAGGAEVPRGLKPVSLPEEHLLAMSGALAAWFGVRVHVRQIRLVSSPAWSQQGRVWVQASHRLER